MYSQELRGFFCLQNTNRFIKLAGSLTPAKDKRYAYGILVGKSEEEDHLEILNLDWSKILKLI
jgi:hypothetical protein